MVPFEELKARQSVIWGNGPYERMPVHYASLTEHLLRALEPRPGLRWLDVATGTGVVALAAAAVGAQVTGVDLAPALVDAARRLAGENGLSIRYDVGDAEELPYEDAGFDVVSSNIGVMFAPDHTAVARELARVCRPGGRLGLTCWKPEGGVADIFKLMRPFQPPPPPGAGNPFDWGRRRHVEELLGSAFELTFEEGDAPQLGESGEDVWKLFSTSYGPTKTLADSLEPERGEELHRAWVDFYEGYRVDGGIRQPRPYLLVLALRR